MQTQSPPGSPVLIIPPPATDQPTPTQATPAANPASGGPHSSAPDAVAVTAQRCSKPHTAPAQQHSMHNSAAPLVAASRPPVNSGVLVAPATSNTHPFSQATASISTNGAVPINAPAPASTAAAPSAAVDIANGAVNIAHGAAAGHGAPNGAGGPAAPPGGTVAAGGQLRQLGAAVHAVQSVQYTGVNGVVGTDRLNGQAQQRGAKQGDAAGASMEGLQPGTMAAEKATLSQSGIGSSDREGGSGQSKGADAAVAGPSRTSNSRKAQPRGGVETTLGSTGAGPVASQEGAVVGQDEGPVDVREGCVACTAGERCVLHDLDALGELNAKLAWAAREGQEVSVNVETAYELFGEAVLSWIPLARLGGTIL